jgi:molecular chaperone DnaK
MSDAKLSAGDIDECILVGGSTRMPRVREIAKEIFGKEPNKSVNPDEAVAIGAAVQGGILGGDVKEQMVLLDVTPLSLGVETLGGVMTVLIPRNTTIPTEKKEIFSTAADNQTEVTIHVLQGEREFARDNRTLGRFNLQGLPPAPRGLPQVEVAFKIDANGILSVSAKDMATAKVQSIEITGSSGLSKDEVSKMQHDAEAHAEEDKKRREVIDLKNQGDSMAYQMEKMLKDAGEKVPASDRGDVESGVSALREALKGDDAQAIKRAMENLEKAGHKVAAAMYQQQAPGAAAGPSAGPQQAPPKEEPKGGKGGEEVIDAEYEVKE